MEFAFSQEQEELRREARSFLEANPDAPLAIHRARAALPAPSGESVSKAREREEGGG